jgi:hypothetical protein
MDSKNKPATRKELEEEINKLADWCTRHHILLGNRIKELEKRAGIKSPD